MGTGRTSSVFPVPFGEWGLGVFVALLSPLVLGDIERLLLKARFYPPAIFLFQRRHLRRFPCLFQRNSDPVFAVSVVCVTGAGALRKDRVDFPTVPVSSGNLDRHAPATQHFFHRVAGLEKRLSTLKDVGLPQSVLRVLRLVEMRLNRE